MLSNFWTPKSDSSCCKNFVIRCALTNKQSTVPERILARSILDFHGMSLKNQPTTTGFPSKWRLRNEHRNSILMTRHYQALGRFLGSASDWLAEANFLCGATNRSCYPELGSDASSVWNFCGRSSGVICTGKPVVASQNVGCFSQATMGLANQSNRKYEKLRTEVAHLT